MATSANRSFSRPRLLRAVLLVALLAGFTGCDEGTADRIKERSAVFLKLNDAQKKRIIDGMFEVGDTGDMVYMAIGAPVRVKSKVVKEGTIEMWVYVNYITTHGAASLALNNPGGTPGRTRSTDPTDAAQSLAVPEAEANTLYVFFLNGVVTQIKLDTQGRK